MVYKNLSSWWLPIALMLLFFFGGPFLSAMKLISPDTGLLLFLSASVFGLWASVTGIYYVLVLNRRIGFSSLYSGIIQLGFVLSFGLTVYDTPMLNEITTDLLHPPEIFVEGEEGRVKVDYQNKFAEIQRQEYSGIKPVNIDLSPEEVYSQLIQVLKENSQINIVKVDEQKFKIEGYEVTPVFGFIDDFSIRIQPRGAGTIVDMRSRSRSQLAGGDFGVNALRIQRVLGALRSF